MKLVFPGGKTKAFTLSYDDGIYQDIRFIDLLNKYNIKGTFNVSYGMLFEETPWETEGVVVPRLKDHQIKDVYHNHEVACHGLTHPNLAYETRDEMTRQVSEDRTQLERLVGYDVTGLAYPFGGYSDEVIEVLQECGIEYGRTVHSSHNFDIPEDFYRWQATCHHNDKKLFTLAQQFLESKDTGLLFYVWGHTYEFDVDQNWDRIEQFLKLVSNKDDIWYATNIEIIHYIKAFEQLIYNKQDKTMYNPSNQVVFVKIDEKVYEVNPNTTIKT